MGKHSFSLINLIEASTIIRRNMWNNILTFIFIAVDLIYYKKLYNNIPNFEMTSV